MGHERPLLCLTLALLTGLAACQPADLTAVGRPPVGPSSASGRVWLVGGQRPVVPDGWQVEHLLADLYRVVVPASDADKAYALLSAQPGVQFVEPNFRYHLTQPVAVMAAGDEPAVVPALRDKPDAELSWNLRQTGVDVAWNLTTGLRSLKVAIIDSGVDPDHPDLKDHMLPLIDVWEETEGPDVLRTTTETLDFDGKDGNGHGTHVAGILAGTLDRETGIGGVAPGVTIQPIKATDYEGNTSAYTLAKAITRAVSEGCKVINISIGGPPDAAEGKTLLQTVEFAIAQGVVIVAATGNESDRRVDKVSPVAIPAAYPGVIAVSAVTDQDKVANYANGGPQTTVAAPGGGGNKREGARIRSTWPTYLTYEGMKASIDGPYAELAGTSMACPHVAGAAALLLSREPQLTPAQVKLRLAGTAVDVGPPGYDTATGYGRIEVDRALLATGHGG